MADSSEPFPRVFVKRLMQQGSSSTRTRTPLQAAAAFQTAVLDKVLAIDNTTESRKISRIRRAAALAESHNPPPPPPPTQRRRGRAVGRVRARPQLQRTRVGVTFREMRRVNRLWREYIDVLRGPSQLRSGAVLREKLQRADLHGALMRVVQSRNAGVVGLTGIVVVESKLAFQLVTRRNAVRLVPKAHTVFDVHHPAAIFRFHGNQLLSQAADRSTRKFKPKAKL